MVADDSGFASELYDSTICLDPQLLAQAEGLVEKVALCTFVVFPKEKRFFFSPGMVSILGPVASQDMIMDAYLQYADSSERRALTVRYEEAFYDLIADNSKVVTFEHNLNSFNGHTYHICVSMQKVKKDNHYIIFGMVEDRTQSFGEIVYEKLLSDSIEGYVLCYDESDDFCRFNSSMAELIDIPTHELSHASRELSNFVHPEDYAAFVSVLTRSSWGKKSQSKDFRVFSPAKGEVWVHSCGVFRFVAPDQKKYMIGIFVDVTDRKAADSLQRIIIDGSEAITFTADMKRGILTFSENLRNTFPDMELTYTGDIINIMAEEVIEDDRRRFIETFTYLVDEEKDNF